jgi:UDP:flavonoid glycosyltransferase YjiC (YdhE family)
VAYHRLGLKGNLQRASAVRIRRSVDQILRDPEYRRRVGEMGRRIRESEAYVRGAEILFEALRRHFPNLHPPDSARSSTLPDPSSHPAERKL